MKVRAVKQADLEDLREDFGQATDAFLVDFRGLTVNQVTDLRSKLRQAGASYKVVKNTLARNACKGTKLEPLSDHFRGPTAIARTLGETETTQLAKTLSDFADGHPAFELKAGFVGETVLTAEQCKAVAKIPSREELLSKLAYLLQSPMQRLATVLQAPSRNLAVVLNQVAEKKTD